MYKRQKYDNAKKMMDKLGEKRIERFNRMHKLITFHEGEIVLLRSNPVGKRIDNTAKKLFRLYEGPYLLQRRKGRHTFIVYDPTKRKTIGKYHASAFRKFYG